MINRRWRNLKQKYKLKNKDIANILGLNKHYVRNATAPSKELPTWAKAMIFIDEKNGKNEKTS